MSLKHFHVVFIILAILCTLGYGAWGIFTSGDVGPLVRVSGWFSFILGIGLIFYGRWFIKKSKNIIT